MPETAGNYQIGAASADHRIELRQRSLEGAIQGGAGGEPTPPLLSISGSRPL